MTLYLGGRVVIASESRRAETCLGIGLPVAVPAAQRPVDVFLDVGVVFDVREARRLAPVATARAVRTAEMIAAFGDRYDPGGLHALRRHGRRGFRRARTERMW